MGDLTDRDHAELLLLYQVTIEDIERTKQWGWTVAYTTIAAQGASLGLFMAYDLQGDLWIGKSVFIGLVVAFALLGRNQIRHAQAGLDGFRTRIKKVRERFGESFKGCFGESNPKRQWPLEPVVWASSIVMCILIAAAAHG